MRIAIITHTKTKIIHTLTILILITQCTPKKPSTFNTERALKDIEYQVSLGPRIPGSQAHQKTRAYIISELSAWKWEAEEEEQYFEEKAIFNIIGRRGNKSPWILLGAHYDSRLLADHDPDLMKRNQPVPGANDGASGVAVLLELARTLPRNLGQTIWLVFFDAEDNGNIPGYDWIMGSRAFVQNMSTFPDQVIIIDMIGDKDLNIYKEKNSDVTLTNSIWDLANSLDFHQFIPTPKYRILDDHIPFIEVGVPSVDIIDFDYPYYHTTQDTFDKVAAESLKVVGETLRVWLMHQSGNQK